MGGIAIFVLALVLPFFLSDTGRIKDSLTRWDEVPQESEGNRRQGKVSAFENSSCRTPSYPEEGEE